MKFPFARITMIFTLATLISLPVSGLGLFPGKAEALSSGSMPLASNIFVDIAKKQNPAVVNVSTRAKPQSLVSPRDFPAPGRPR